MSWQSWHQIASRRERLSVMRKFGDVRIQIFVLLRRILFLSSFVTLPELLVPRRERPRVDLSQRLVLASLVSRALSLRRLWHLRAGEGGRARRVDRSSLGGSPRIVFAARRRSPCPCPCLSRSPASAAVHFSPPLSGLDLARRASAVWASASTHRIRMCVLALHIKHAIARKIEWAVGVLQVLPTLVYSLVHPHFGLHPSCAYPPGPYAAPARTALYLDRVLHAIFARRKREARCVKHAVYMEGGAPRSLAARFVSGYLLYFPGYYNHPSFVTPPDVFRTLVLPVLDGLFFSDSVFARSLLPTALHVHMGRSRAVRSSLGIHYPIPALVRPETHPPRSLRTRDEGCSFIFAGAARIIFGGRRCYCHRPTSTTAAPPLPRPRPSTSPTRALTSPVCSAPGLRMRSPYRRTCTVCVRIPVRIPLRLSKHRLRKQDSVAEHDHLLSSPTADEKILLGEKDGYAPALLLFGPVFGASLARESRDADVPLLREDVVKGERGAGGSNGEQRASHAQGLRARRHRRVDADDDVLLLRAAPPAGVVRHRRGDANVYKNAGGRREWVQGHR
ncbi:hypothetical protein B0H14DRAFT_3638772 [Mycena olivaceomarginata]|nr:hypothetical protein B0H14DRAFT_3638772 [Mycena olivaceomarginata]